MFFSIIIAIYNAEQSLERCLKSLQAQSYEDYEVILIDDGSKDRSYAICERFAKEDARLKLIHQTNKGASAARNEGLKQAKGEYICFVDSDDYVSSDYLNQLFFKLNTERTDVLFFGYNRVDQSGHITGAFLPPNGMTDLNLLSSLSDRDMFGYTWIKCFSKESIGNTLFPEDMTLFEDEVFTCRVLEKADSIDTLTQPLYYYVVGGESALTRRTYDNYCKLSDRVYSCWERLVYDNTGNETFLEHKANVFVSRCKYYGFERDVSTKDYFESLADTHFFKVHTEWTKLDRFIQNKTIIVLKAARYLYRLKTQVAAYKKARAKNGFNIW